MKNILNNFSFVLHSVTFFLLLLFPIIIIKNNSFYDSFFYIKTKETEAERERAIKKRAGERERQKENVLIFNLSCFVSDSFNYF